MAVPFIDLQRFEPDFLDRWAVKCREITEHTRFVGGPEVVALEERLAALWQVPQVVACANGTDALQLALRAVGVGEGDRVLIPDATFWATFEAVVNCGARPVTVDIDRQDLQMDFDLFRQAVERHRPAAAILVHLYGWGSARLAEFRAFCRERQLPLIEDGAQSFGVEWQGESLYRGALLASISFYPAKVLGACGDAGAVSCTDPALAETLRQLGNHGRTGHYDHGLVGWNSRMSGFDGAYLNLSLDYVDARLKSRRRIARRYREVLGELGVETVGPPPEYVENGYLNVCRVPAGRREKIQEHLRARGIGSGAVYPGSMSKQSGAAPFLVEAVGGGEAEALAATVLNLPLFAYLKDEEFDEVLAAVASAKL
jgi:dTDP-4-amino-4,6-dideoxygalactose transaminase